MFCFHLSYFAYFWDAHAVRCIQQQKLIESVLLTKLSRACVDLIAPFDRRCPLIYVSSFRSCLLSRLERLPRLSMCNITVASTVGTWILTLVKQLAQRTYVPFRRSRSLLTRASKSTQFSYYSLKYKHERPNSLHRRS